MTIQKEILIGAGLILILSLIAGNILSDYHLKEYRTTLEQQQTEQQQLLASIASVTAKNSADDIGAALVTDCPVPERERFDTLLSSLDQGLSKIELTELERLFGRCGSFYADRKLVMVSRLSREVSVYEDVTMQLATIAGEGEKDKANLDEWKELVRLEQEQSLHFVKLVDAQDRIINTLLAGEAPKGETVQGIAEEAREIQENLLLTNTQAASIRSQLISI